MKKSLLKKMTKAASLALVSGIMLCGAGLASNTNVHAQGNPYLSVKQNERVLKLSNKKANYIEEQGSRKATQKAYAKVFGTKRVRRNVKKSNKRAVRKGNKRVARRNASKRSAARRAALRRAEAAKKNARRSLRHRAVKPINRRAYRAHRRAVKNFRHSRYYRNVWSSAEKINKRAVRVDQARLNKTNKANSSKHLTKYEHRALKSSIKAQQRHINYMMGYVNHDAHMLSLAK